MGGALAILNPCGFPLLVAHLSLSMRGSPGAGGATRAGVIRGAAVAGGFVTTMLALSIPLALGLQQAVRILPRAGLAVGILLAVVGVAMLLGLSPSLPARIRPRPLDGSMRSFFMLGIAQGVVALGCTLPVFLAVVGASSTGSGVGGVLRTVGSYGAGAATLLVILSAAAASAGGALTSKVRNATRHVRMMSALLLMGSGSYLTYFWWRLSFGSSSSLSSDPVVSTVQAFSSWLYRFAGSGDAVILSTALVVGLSAVVASVTWRSRNGSSSPDPG